ncbi:hypothetical protein N1851_030297 [Merluccius polli]|uniref:DUF6729 domain-containing protein n=1 Tax=Merluccius polli TaxID=89951 RepID=A0AA47M5W6_MERPO|nr:hypothetical protein N1851_030297 [Merluccius polli]
MNSSGIYRKVREVIDVDSRYYLLEGDYPRCSKCSQHGLSWSKDMLSSQLDVAHRSLFPAVLTTQLALDRKCMTFLKPEDRSSYLQSAIEEAHSEKWARQTIRYLSDCERHMKWLPFVPSAAVHSPFHSPNGLRQSTPTTSSAIWMRLKGVITSTYGRILKMDSTKKITKKLAGGIGDIAAWMTNIGNEFGQVLNSVLTTGEGVSSVVKLFHPWRSAVHLDSFHFMRRFNCGLTTEHHPLYGTFCAKLSSCIFEWDQEDVQRLKEAKRAEWKSSHSGHAPTEEQLMATISPGELKRHCRRRTREVEEIRSMISGLLESVWELTGTTGAASGEP